jgi:hypothetical protein
LLDVNPGSSYANNPTIKIVQSYADGYRATLSLDNQHTGGREYQLLSFNNSDGGFGDGGGFSIRDVDGSNADRLVILGSGNVGIGTTSPDYLLHLVKNASGAVNLLDISGNDGSGDGGSGIILSDNNTGKWTIFQRNQSPAYALHFATGEGGTVANAKMTIQTDGNVGIGTTAPTKELTVEGDISASGDYYVQDQNKIIGEARLNISSSSALTMYAGAAMTFYQRGTDDITFFTGSANNKVLHIDNSNSGNVGIGTVGADVPKRLTVEGDISASGTIYGSELNLDIGTSDPPGDAPAEGTIRAVWSGGARSPVYKIFAYLNGGWRSTTLS